MNMMEMLLANHTCTWCYSHGLHRIESSLGSNNNRNALGLPGEFDQPQRLQVITKNLNVEKWLLSLISDEFVSIGLASCL